MSSIYHLLLVTRLLKYGVHTGKSTNHKCTLDVVSEMESTLISSLDPNNVAVSAEALLCLLQSLFLLEVAIVRCYCF